MNLKKFKTLLENEKLRLVTELQQHPVQSADGDRTLSSFNKSSEAASEQVETERQMSLVQQLNLQLAEVEHCLKKIADGTYGKCDGCGQDIPEERLEALPKASYCLACKAKHVKIPVNQ
jgi:RNA polymerase-binding transcription factor DksA